jgi:hypothetical protein
LQLNILHGRLAQALNLADDVDFSITRRPLRTVEDLARGNRLFASDFERLGYAPETALEGDQIIVFYGVSSPLVIREVKSSYYTIIGPAYVDGVMEGGFLRDGNPPSKAFMLI